MSAAKPHLRQHLPPVCGGIYREPEKAAEWSAKLPVGKRVVVTYVHGQAVGQTAAASLRAAGIDARYLSGSVEGWIEALYRWQRDLTAESHSWPPREVA